MSSSPVLSRGEFLSAFPPPPPATFHRVTAENFCPFCASNHEPNTAHRQPWRRILYERQGYPDNYTDASFLSQLVTNAHVVSVPFHLLVLDACVVAARISLVCIFLGVFYHLDESPDTIDILILSDLLLILGGLFFFLLCRSCIQRDTNNSAKPQQTNALRGVTRPSAAMQNVTKTLDDDDEDADEDDDDEEAELVSNLRKGTKRIVPSPFASSLPSDVLSSPTSAHSSSPTALSLPLSFAFSDTSFTWFFSACQRLLLLMACLLAVSPVLKTLTAAYSEDTIWALTFLLAVIHIVLHDYHYINYAHQYDSMELFSFAVTNNSASSKTQQQDELKGVSTNKLHGTISLNAGIFASVLLASRLPHALHVFGFSLFAFLIFAGFPLLFHHIRRLSLHLHIFMCILVFSIAFITVSAISALLALVLFLTVLFVNLFCPFFFQYVQRYKNEIHGPWDYDDAPELDSDNL